MSGPFHGSLAALLDDAAVFPPGDLPLPDAVAAHRAHLAAPYAALLGPLVLPLDDLGRLAGVDGVAGVAGVDGGPLRVSVTLPEPGSAAAALESARRIAGLEVVALETPLPSGVDGPRALRDLPLDAPVPVWVEVPRDARRRDVVAELAERGLHAKLRTGGATAALHPDAAELADAVVALVRADVPFKATAGLHRAVRHTDPATGFEQHGFVNLMIAADAVADGADAADAAALLALRDVDRLLAAMPSPLGPRAGSRTLRSIGTCSIAEPVADLERLGLLAVTA